MKVPCEPSSFAGPLYSSALESFSFWFFIYNFLLVFFTLFCIYCFGFIYFVLYFRHSYNTQSLSFRLENCFSSFLILIFWLSVFCKNSSCCLFTWGVLSYNQPFLRNPFKWKATTSFMWSYTTWVNNQAHVDSKLFYKRANTFYRYCKLQYEKQAFAQ